jgi:hypothetical protein
MSTQLLAQPCLPQITAVSLTIARTQYPIADYMLASHEGIA